MLTRKENGKLCILHFSVKHKKSQVFRKNAVCTLIEKKTESDFFFNLNILFIKTHFTISTKIRIRRCLKQFNGRYNKAKFALF